MSPDINHSGSASVYTEPLDLLQGLYPYVAGMQKQSNSAYFSGYNPDYWGEAYVEPCPQEEIPRHSFRRLSGTYHIIPDYLACIYVLTLLSRSLKPTTRFSTSETSSSGAS